MNFPLGFISQGSGGGSGGAAFELISTVLVSSAGNVTFTSIPQTYKHLQVKVVGRSNTGGPDLAVYFNNDFATAAASHDLRGNGSSVVSAAYTGQVGATVQSAVASSSSTTNVFGAAIIDVLDYTSTNKNKTVRFLYGRQDPSIGPIVGLASGVWLSTTAISQILVAGGNGFATGSRVSLYGIKG